MEADNKLVATLEDKAIDIRKKLCYGTIEIGPAHIGGSLSATDFVVALYYHYLKYDTKNPQWDGRDRFILSKGHIGFLLYNVFADLGMYEFETFYNGYNKIDGKFGQHPNRKYVPGIEASTGSLGHGLSIATGVALAGRSNKKNYRVYCMTGDGELQEGSNWEAIMAAGHYQLGNLIAIVDRNGYQISGYTEDVISIEPLEEKFKAFNWDVISVEDGNDMRQVTGALESLPKPDCLAQRKPICIVSRTKKGAGVSFMENAAKWHVGSVDEEKYTECCELIEQTRKWSK
jgi:transketolase